MLAASLLCGAVSAQVATQGDASLLARLQASRVLP